MNNKDTQSTTQDQVQKATLLVRLSRVLLPLIAIGCGLLLTMWLVSTKPKARQQPKIKNTTFVQVEKIRSSDEPILIQGMGTIRPAKSITLSSEVSGKIINLSPAFVPGGQFLAGERIAKIDSRTYELLLLQKKSDILSAESELHLEKGNQMVAKKEFELLGESVSEIEESLMLRAPQLDQSQAQFESAKAVYAQAQLDVDRTTITAPFNGMIQSIDTNTGSLLNVGSGLAQFIGTDEFWLEILLPVNELQWIDIPQSDDTPGSTVRIYNDSHWGERYREGEIVGLLPELETNGRLAKVLVRIHDPLALLEENTNSPRVLIDSYVRAEIHGKTIENGIAINRSDIHDGNTIWMMTPEESLEIRTITPVFRNKDKIIVTSGLERGEFYITSNIAAPVTGMLLEKEDSPQPRSEKSSARK